MTQRETGAPAPDVPHDGVKGQETSGQGSARASREPSAPRRAAVSAPSGATRTSTSGTEYANTSNVDALDSDEDGGGKVSDLDQTEEESAASEAEADYGPPFTARSFGGELVWARCETFETKVLRIRPGEVVAISTKGRHNFTAMLTGGRAVLEVRSEHGQSTLEHRELLPAVPVEIPADGIYRVVALSEVEIFVAYGIGDPPG